MFMIRCFLFSGINPSGITYDNRKRIVGQLSLVLEFNFPHLGHLPFLTHKATLFPSQLTIREGEA